MVKLEIRFHFNYVYFCVNKYSPYLYGYIIYIKLNTYIYVSIYTTSNLGFPTFYECHKQTIPGHI